MKIAIGLPNALPRTAGPSLVAFAREAEAAGFSSLGTIGRIVYDSHEELIALAACAGSTSRIGLATTVLISPARETVLLAKQTATLHAISGGRLTLGFGVGWRDDDFRALGTEAQYEGRGSVIARQIETLRRVWSGASVGDGIGAVGPTLGPGAAPEILLGGASEAPLRRAGRLADGFLSAPAPPATIAAHYAVVKRAWQEAGRPGAPRLVAPRYFVLGDDARAAAEANVRAYYSVGGDAAVQGVLSGLVTDTDGVRSAVAELEAIGVDEAFFWPMNADLRQIERLAKALH